MALFSEKKLKFKTLLMGHENLQRGYRGRLVMNFGADFSLEPEKVYVAYETSHLFLTKREAVEAMKEGFEEEDVPDSGAVTVACRFEGPRLRLGLFQQWKNNPLRAWGLSWSARLPISELEASGALPVHPGLLGQDPDDLLPCLNPDLHPPPPAL